MLYNVCATVSCSSKIEAGRLRLEFKATQAADLVDEVIRTFKRQLEDKKQTLELTIPPVLPSMWADRVRVGQVLTNLVSSAFKYTSTRPHAKVEVGFTHINKERVYFVRDNGVGFDMQYYAKLLKPFQRLHSNEIFSGSGVGLATVQRIIERHGGRIWAEATPDFGTTFYMTLSSA